MREPMKVIACINNKGGTAKSATSVSLAAFLGQKRPTLLVDMDPQGHCAQCFALDAPSLSPTVYDVLFERCEPAAAVRRLRDRLDLLPANAQLAIGEIELRDELQREERLHTALAGLEYEFAVIDCPPSLGLLAINAMIAADVLVVPINSALAFQGTYQLFELIATIRSRYRKTWDVRALQTFYRTGVRESEQLNETLRDKFKTLLFDTRINLNTQIAVAMANGRPITEFPDSSGYFDYRRLTEEVLRVTGTQAQGIEGDATRKGRARRDRGAGSEPQ